MRSEQLEAAAVPIGEIGLGPVQRDREQLVGREAQGARHRVGDVEWPVKLAIDTRVLELPHRRDVGEPDGACVARAAPVNDERVVGNVCGQDPRRAWELRVRRVGRPPDRPLREIQLRARREGRWNQPR